MKKEKENFILHLIRTNALKFGKFKLKNERISPYFVNLASAMNNGMNASITARAYAKEIVKEIGMDFDFIFGPAYKGIPLSSLVASKLWSIHFINKRWGYDRKEKKEYGDKNEEIIVGDLRNGDIVLIVDDVITTGKTKLESWKRLKKARIDLTAKGILVAIDRQELDEKERLLLEQEGLEIYSILKIKDIFDYLFKRKIKLKSPQQTILDQDAGEKIYVDEKIYDEFNAYFEKYGSC